MTTSPADELKRLRASIDNIDAAVVHMLAERFKATKAVGELKAANNLPPADKANGAAIVLCPGGAYDRSPCGTGTSAKVACLAADGKLAPGKVWRQESIVGGVFEASYVIPDTSRENEIIPTITGRAFVNGDVKILIDPADPFRFGI